MNNTQDRPFVTKLLQTKLGLLAQRLQKQASPTGSNTSLVTQEQLVSEAISLLSEYYRFLSEPNFQPINPIVDCEPSPNDFNKNFQRILDDLTVLFTEFENIETTVLGNFNYMVSRLNRLNGNLKETSSSLGDYILLSDHSTKDAIFFSDSFSNLSRIESGSPLLNNEQLEINQAEGLLTLPIDRNQQKKIIVKELPVINSNSNGVAGNNYEPGAPYNGDITKILDGNADTWFEYERVVSTDDNVPLVLDFTVNLGLEQTVNFIRVNPNNFGTRTQVEVLSIDTSLDGKKFTSIKDDIPIAGWTVQDEDNVFILSPTTSKYAGQGLYTFTPRKVKYIHFSLRQSTAYIIQTSTIDRFRYAIGIRDIHIEALPFKVKGEVVSTEYKSADEIKKVVLLSNQNPDAATSSTLASISHLVSPDNGITWYNIRPKVTAGLANISQEIPELLDFNGVSSNTIVTSSPVFGLRYKAIMERYPDAFEAGSSDLADSYDSSTELHKSPVSTPFALTLQQKPIAGTVKLIDTNFGTRGIDEQKYFLGTGTGAKISFQLPWNPMPRKKSKTYSSGKWYLTLSDDETVYVGEEVWSKADLSSAGANDKVYSINHSTGKIIFGDGTKGKAVPSGAIIAIAFNEEQISPTGGEIHLTSLQFPTVEDKSQIELRSYEPLSFCSVVLAKGANEHKIEGQITSTFPPTFSDAAVFTSEKTFIDGSTELTTPGWYSIDYTNNIVYSYTRTSVSVDTIINYYRNKVTVIPSDKWEFNSSNSIIIHPDAWETFDLGADYTGDTDTVPSSVKYFNLRQLAPVKGTLSFSDTTVFAKELDFIDGRSELFGFTKVTEEIPALTGTGAVTTFTLKAKITTDVNYPVVFSNSTVFGTSVNPPITDGQYYVNTSTRVVSVYLSSNVDSPGTITYYSQNSNTSLSGRYSVNYQTGEVYTYTTTAGGTATYQYSDYRIRYPLARVIPEEDYEVDILNSKVTIKDREILQAQRIPQVTSLGTRDRFYQVSYQFMSSSRENVKEIEPFFSPILKDMSLKVITKSRLV